MEKSKEIDLERVKVEQVTDYFDLADIETALSRHHPLGHKKAMGRRIYYAASYRGTWVGVLLFDIPARRNKHREQRIGWTGEQLASRLQHVANNSRFLIVPAFAGVKNLASKVLSLATARLSNDWLKHYGVPLLAVETYVDPEHNENQGSCYLAAGWERLGYSSGYEAHNQERTHSKWYFLKSLHKDSFAALSSPIPHALMTGVKAVSGRSNNNYVLDAAKLDIRALQRDLAQIEDPRGGQGRRYRFLPLLSLCICAVISGYTQYRQIADWIKRLSSAERAKFGLPGDRTPDESTIGKFLSKIDPAKLQTTLSKWLKTTYQQEVDFSTVLIDGKALRATSSNAKEQAGFLNVFANELGIVIDQVPTGKGGGEKTAIKQVLKAELDLTGKIVIADALHTDREIIAAIEKKTPRMSSLSKAIRNL